MRKMLHNTLLLFLVGRDDILNFGLNVVYIMVSWSNASQDEEETITNDSFL